VGIIIALIARAWEPISPVNRIRPRLLSVWRPIFLRIIFFVIAGSRGIGAFGVAGEAAWIAHVLIVIAVIFIIISFFSGRRGTPVV